MFAPPLYPCHKTKQEEGEEQTFLLLSSPVLLLISVSMQRDR